MMGRKDLVPRGSSRWAPYSTSQQWAQRGNIPGGYQGNRTQSDHLGNTIAQQQSGFLHGRVLAPTPSSNEDMTQKIEKLEGDQPHQMHTEGADQLVGWYSLPIEIRYIILGLALPQSIVFHPGRPRTRAAEATEPPPDEISNILTVSRQFCTPAVLYKTILYEAACQGLALVIRTKSDWLGFTKEPIGKRVNKYPFKTVLIAVDSHSLDFAPVEDFTKSTKRSPPGIKSSLPDLQRIVLEVDIPYMEALPNVDMLFKILDGEYPALRELVYEVDGETENLASATQGVDEYCRGFVQGLLESIASNPALVKRSWWVWLCMQAEKADVAFELTWPIQLWCQTVVTARYMAEKLAVKFECEGRVGWAPQRLPQGVIDLYPRSYRPYLERINTVPSNQFYGRQSRKDLTGDE